MVFGLVVDVDAETRELIFTMGSEGRFFGEQLTITVNSTPSRPSGRTLPVETSSQPW